MRILGAFVVGWVVGATLVIAEHHQRLLICDEESLTEIERPSLAKAGEVETVMVFGQCWGPDGRITEDIVVELSD